MKAETENSARRPFFPAEHVAPVFLLWLAVFAASLFSPPVLDDADATHAQAARAIATTGDWVTLHVNGIRYLEKPPLPYWLGAISFRLFGFNTFALHLPLALSVLALAAVAYLWARLAFDERAAFYAALATLSCLGVFLFTRIFIPEALLSLFLAIALYAFLHSIDEGNVNQRLHPFIMSAAVACAVLAKGLVALIFFLGSLAVYSALTGCWRRLRCLRPLLSIPLFLLIAAPWHILASIRNPGAAGAHGFAWFYFINEHVLRFLGRRTPHDYNKLPALLYWLLHLVWLFPWSLFAPVAVILGWRHRARLRARSGAPQTFATRSTLLLLIYTGLVLLFFAFSTNQEYYTFPVYLPLLLLLCAGLARAERLFPTDLALRRWLFASHAAFTAVGIAIAGALIYSLWTSAHNAYASDIGPLLAHRGVSGYTLSLSHFFDLTGPSFAALRLPAAIAAVAFLLGPGIAWNFRLRHSHMASTAAIALTGAVFLIAAHIALGRFAPLLSSRTFATKIQQLRTTRTVAPDTQLLLFGDQALGSSIPFYLGEQIALVDGRSSSMLFGSTFPDAPHIFLTSRDLLTAWGNGPRKLLFVPAENRLEVDHLLGPHQLILEESAGKTLLTDRPLSAPNRANPAVPASLTPSPHSPTMRANPPAPLPPSSLP